MEMATPETHTSSSPLLYFYFFTIFNFFSSLATVLVPFPNSNGKRTEDSAVFSFFKNFKKN
jgi:hypothetical protein